MKVMGATAGDTWRELCEVCEGVRLCCCVGDMIG